jgi:Chaperone for flagella basal body P-ring formation
MLLLWALGVGFPVPASSLCSATPQAAVADYRANLSPEMAGGASGKGFRVWRTSNDVALRRQWFWIESCSGPEHPAQLFWIPLPFETNRAVTRMDAAGQDSILVRLGDDVLVVKSGDTFSMRLAGQALEAGEKGKRVHVRIKAWRDSRVLVGTVSGKDEIDLTD